MRSASRTRTHTGDADAALTAQAKRQLRDLGSSAAKKLGQHFLVDRFVLETIIAAADLAPDDLVVEVGPGLGVLTEELGRRAGKVVAVEVDSGLALALEARLSNSSPVRVVNANILDVDPGDLVREEGGADEGQARYKVVANLPYYVAAPILRHFLEAAARPALIVVMVQKEVGQSIAASPGRMSIQGVSVQVYGNPTIVGIVPPRAFCPEPKVDSAIVRIDVLPQPAVKSDIAGFFEVVRAGFSAPRKQLRNSLSMGLQVGAAEAEDLLSEAGIGPERRPGTLSIAEWCRLSEACTRRGKR